MDDGGPDSVRSSRPERPPPGRALPAVDQVDRTGVNARAAGLVRTSRWSRPSWGSVRVLASGAATGDARDAGRPVDGDAMATAMIRTPRGRMSHDQRHQADWLASEGTWPQRRSLSRVLRVECEPWRLPKRRGPRPAPFVGSFSGTDRSPMGRSATHRLQRALTAVGVEHDVKVFPTPAMGSSTTTTRPT